MLELNKPGILNGDDNVRMHSLLFEQNPDAVFSFDLDGKFICANKALLALAECTLEEVLSTNFLSFIPADEAERVIEHFNQAKRGHIQRYETKAITASGRSIIISVINFPVIVDEKVISVYGSARDITESKLKEDQLIQSEDKYRSIIEKSLSAFLLTNPEATVAEANQAALNMFGYSLEEIKKLTRSQLLDSSAENLPAFLETRNKYGQATGELIGIRKNGERFPCEFSSVMFRDSEGEYKRIINIVDISARKANEKEIYHKQELLNAIIDNADEGIAVTNTDGQFVIFNHAMAGLLGASKQDSSAYDWSTIYNIYYPDTHQPVPKNELPIVRAMRGDVVKNKIYLIKNPIRGDVYISISSSPIKDSEGKIVAGMVIDRDITSQIKTERDLKKAIYELEQSNLRFTYATKAASDAIWDWDVITNDLYWGPGFESLFGYSVSAKVNIKSWIDHIHTADQKRVLTSIQNALNQPETDNWVEEYIYIKADGTHAYVVDKGLIIRDGKGKAIRMIGAMQDVTKSKLNEAALLESNERFSIAAKATSEAIWEWNANDPDIFKEYGYKELFGYDLPNNIGQVSFWASKVHPDEIEKLFTKMKFIRDSTSETTWTLEYRFLKADNEYIHIKEKAILLRNKNGQLLRMIGSMQDVTKQKMEEQQLKLLESVITNSTDAVMITTVENKTGKERKIIYVNRSFTNMTGYLPEEAIGQTPKILYGPKTCTDELARLWRAMEDKEPCETEFINYTKSGDEYWVQVAVAPVQDSRGNYTHYIAIERDITERKRQELEKEILIKDLTQKIKDLKQFTYITSHNLRSPLANMLGLINLTEDIIVEDDTLSTILTGFKTSTELLNNTINDLLEILDAKHNQVVQKVEIDIAETLKNVLNQLKHLTDEIKPTIDCNFKQADKVNFNKVYLESILLNLLTNALKYRSHKRELHITITTSIINDKLVLTFQDNGIGIDVDRHKDRIFGFYQKFHDNRDSKGLGLYLIKSQMEDMGGTVEIESKLNEGTKFILAF